jgi:hypothetical protein
VIPAPAQSDSGPAICSAKGCREIARWGLLWNNPKLHDPERRKVWTACDQHRESLAQFLQLRGFLRDVVPVESLADQPG